MALLRGLAPAAVSRFSSPLLSGGLLAALMLFAVACGGGAENGSGAADQGQRASPTSALVTIYSSPTCGCCHEYGGYLKAEGFEVESIRGEDLAEIKDRLGIPPDMQSCHTSLVQQYFIEGHVPAEAIFKLLEEQPEIGGIALPGMPLGSPGMGGDKEEPFTIYSIVDGRVEEFMTL